MIGLNGIIKNNRYKIKPKFNNETHILYEKIEYKNIYIERRTLKKFLNDKIFLESNEFIIVLEGVVFNKADLIKKHTQNTWEQCIIEMYEKNGETFINELRGSFSGFLFDKRSDTTIIFTDQIGDKPLYFYRENDVVVFSSSIKYILKLFKANNINFKLDIQGAYCLLTHGSMLEDLTPFEGIKRLKAGHYIKIVKEKHKIKRFHLFSNKPNYKLKDDEIIDRLDFLFRQAVERQWQKNNEYGYTNYASLSAGMESRMTTWVLSQFEKNVVNITYSQSDYYDETVPKEISSELRNHLVFKPLNNGLSLYYLDEMVRRNCGVVMYHGPAQVWDTFHLLNHKSMGIVHTGVIGGAVVGTYYQSSKGEKNFSIENGAYSTFLMESFKNLISDYKIEDYKNQEIFIFYNRGMNGVNMGTPLTLQEFTESYSPFCDIDFMEFGLTIPVEKRWAHNIYYKWVIKKYPEAAKYRHNGRKISKTKMREFRLFGKSFTMYDLFRKVINIVFIKEKSMETAIHMNPFDYWYSTNVELKNYMDEYYHKNIDLIETDELKNDVKEMYEKGNTLEKTQVLTLLSTVQNYLHNTDWLIN